MSTTDTSSIANQVLKEFYLAEQIDLLHISLVALMEAVTEGELELILEQSPKSIKQKVSYLAKLIDQVASPQLKNELAKVLNSGDLEFFGSKTFPEFLHTVQRRAEAIRIIKISVAIKFKEKDLKEMVAVLSEQAGRPSVVEVTVERGLIGGAIVRYGNYISDYSIRTRLAQYRADWHKAVTE